MLSKLLMSRVPRTLALAVCAGALIAAVAARPVAGASPRGVRVGSVPALHAASGAPALLPGSTSLHVTVALKPREPAALAAFASAVATPGSALYRHYITPAQFAQRFGPTTAQITAVESSLRAHGLHPGRVTPNGLAIPISSTAGVVAHAFSIAFSRLAAPAGRVAFATTAAPLFDSSVASLVQGVVGLDTASVPEPLALRPRAARGHLIAPHVATGGPQPCAAATAAAPGQRAYTADQIASAYRFSGLYAGGDLGAGQTIAVYELEPNDPNDIAAYQACYGTSAQVSYVGVDGGAGTGSGTGEAALDIEDVIGLAPQAKIIVYQGPNSNSGAPGAGPYDTYNTIMSQDQAKVVTTSWGQCESMEGSADAVAEGILFQEAAAQGQTIVSAAGDNGAEDCYAAGQNLNLGAAVDDPSSQPFVTSVGGTSLSALGPPPAESAWNNGGGLDAILGSSAGAGGGGISSLWSAPSYQANAAASVHVINSASSGGPCGAGGGYCRQVPDVSASADPFAGYLIYFQGAWGGIGGTSAAAPVWGAVIALANASPYCSGTTVGFANPALYRAAGDAYSQYFNDVISGNNDFTGTNGGHFAAGPGYDMATGLGTPIASSLALALCETVTVTNPGAQSATLGKQVSLRIVATDSSHATITYRATGLPSGLSIDHSTGRITGKPRKAGTSKVVLEATDSGGRTGTVTFTWRIQLPAVLSTSPPLAKCSRSHACSYFASRGQTVAVQSGHPARGKLYLVASTGAPIRGAPVSITDGRHALTVRTSRSGTASFTLGSGRNRSVRAVYAGGSAFGPATITFRVRNHR